MLFDLQSPRRRVAIKIIYGTLAVLIGGSLVLTNFGGNDNGIADLFGGGGAESGIEAFDSQIDDANALIQANPNDPLGHLELARAHATAASSVVEQDPETGASQPNAEAAEEYGKAADAWDQYLKLGRGGGEDEGGAALLIANGFFFLAETATDAASADTNVKNAAAAQKIATETTSLVGPNTYYQLIYFSYFAGKDRQAEEAVDQLKKLDPLTPEQEKQLDAQLKQITDRAAQFRKAVKEAAKPQGAQGTPGAPGAAAPGANPFENPLSTPGGGLGGASLGG